MGEKALVLRTCSADMRSDYNDFRWPESGLAEAPDWDPEPVCGCGLHGLLWGEGDGSLLNWSAGAAWLVVEVEAADVVDLGGKVKFPRGVVVHCGDRAAATAYLAEHGERCLATMVGGSATASGDRGSATASGDGGSATASGDRGSATASGYGGFATASGYRGSATAGVDGLASAGNGGMIGIRYWDGKRYRLAIGYVGEDGIEPGVAYRVEGGRLVRAEAAAAV